MRPLVLMLVLAGCQEPAKPNLPPPPPSATPTPTPKLVLPAPSDPTARLKAPEPPQPQPPRPDPSLDWLVEAKTPLKRADLLRSFDETWRREHDLVRIYGWRAGAPLLITDDSGDAYERVTVAMQLLKAAGDDDLRTVAAPRTWPLSSPRRPRACARRAPSKVARPPRRPTAPPPPSA